MDEPTISLPPPPRREPYPDFSELQTKQSPWKYIGYRVFSKWVASEKNFLIVRHFGTLNTRIILSLQDEIVELEHRLNRMDEANSRERLPNDTNNGSFRYDGYEDRRNLVQNVLPEKLARYNSFINEYAQLVNRPPLFRDDLETVKTWLDQCYPRSIEPAERAYLDHDDDLIPVHPKARSLFPNSFERCRIFFKSSIMRKYFGRKPRGFYDVEKVATFWTNDRRIEIFSSIVISVIGLSMLIGPLWILEYVEGDAHRLGVITGFITVFFLVVLLLTGAKVFDALVAVAAYSAVLMVFMQHV